MEQTSILYLSAPSLLINSILKNNIKVFYITNCDKSFMSASMNFF